MGGADKACSALGNMNDPTTQGVISLGTSGVVFAYSPKRQKTSGSDHFFVSAILGLNYKMGVTLSAGYSLTWFKKILRQIQLTMS